MNTSNSISQTDESKFYVKDMKLPDSKKISAEMKDIIEKTHIYSFSSSKNSIKSLLIKTFRFLNPLIWLRSSLNKHTIIRGAETQWDATRLLTGKHISLYKAAAQHVQIISKTGSVVDAHYLEASQLVSKLENCGGQKKIFKLNLPEDSPYISKRVELIMKDGTLIDIEELNITEKNKNQLEDVKTAFFQFDKKVIKDALTGRYYIIPSVFVEKLYQSEYYNKETKSFESLNIQSSSSRSIVNENYTTEFPGFQFAKNSPGTQEAKEILKGMNLNNSGWSTYEIGDTLYLVRADDITKLDLSNNADKKITITSREPSLKDKLDDSERGTVLLSMNQLNIYEQYVSEILTFALEGVNVMAYNNPGKGLSNGRKDIKNINASIEAAYQYLSKIKKIRDEKILAKGQCFGAAPSAWLGKKHQDINLMMDQNPVDISEVVNDQIHQWADLYFPADKKIQCFGDKFKLKFANFLRNSYVIHKLVAVIFHGYNTKEDLQQNNGHKLLNINVPDENGKGGDKLVPPHHPLAMLDAINDQRQREVTLSFNIGAGHVTDWWNGSESKASTLNFLDKTGLRKSFFA